MSRVIRPAAVAERTARSESVGFLDRRPFRVVMGPCGQTCTLVWFSVALRPQRRVGLLGTGTEWEGGERVKGSTAETARKRPERQWTGARTMEVLRRCPLAIAQRLVHCAIALSTAVLDRVTKTMCVAPLLTNNLDNSKQKTSNLLSPAPPPYS